MSIFDWFSGPKRFLKQVPERVWFSNEDRKRLFPNEFRNDRAGNTLTIVTAHFDKAVNEICEVLGVSVAYTRVNEPYEWSAAIKPSDANPTPIVIVRAGVLQKVGMPTLPAGLESVRILVYERHLLREKDDEIEAFGERFLKPGEIWFHMSLDDALLKIFAKDWMKDFLRSSAKGGNPWLDSRMITKSIEKAQARMQERAISQKDAESAEEWLKKNVPPK